MNCGICGQELNVPLKPETLDCGGDCLKCMADNGDPECIETLSRFHAPETRADQIHAYEVCRVRQARDNDLPVRGWPFIFVAVVTFLLSCLTSFVGFAVGFTGSGTGLASTATDLTSYSMMIALPTFLVVGAFSRRALAWVYWILYASTSVGVYMLDTANIRVPPPPLVSALPPLVSGKRAFGAMFGLEAILYLILAILAEVMFRVERRRRAALARRAIGLSEIPDK